VLESLEIDEISLVDMPCNQRKWLLYKRAEPLSINDMNRKEWLALSEQPNFQAAELLETLEAEGCEDLTIGEVAEVRGWLEKYLDYVKHENNDGGRSEMTKRIVLDDDEMFVLEATIEKFYDGTLTELEKLELLQQLMDSSPRVFSHLAMIHDVDVPHLVKRKKPKTYEDYQTEQNEQREAMRTRETSTLYDKPPLPEEYHGKPGKKKPPEYYEEEETKATDKARREFLAACLREKTRGECEKLWQENYQEAGERRRRPYSYEEYEAKRRRPKPYQYEEEE